MSDIPREELCKLTSKYGRELFNDPRRCESLLRDHCGGHRREISILVSAIKDRVPHDLLGSSDTVPTGILFPKLARRLENNFALSREAAWWGVETWALALGLISSADIQGEKGSEIPKPTTPDFASQGISQKKDPVSPASAPSRQIQAPRTVIQPSPKPHQSSTKPGLFLMLFVLVLFSGIALIQEWHSMWSARPTTTPSPSQSAPHPVVIGTLYATGDGVRIHEAPTLQAAVIGTVNKGDKVGVVGYDPSKQWAEVVVPGTEQTGWLSRAYLVDAPLPRTLLSSGVVFEVTPFPGSNSAAGMDPIVVFDHGHYLDPTALDEGNWTAYGANRKFYRKFYRSQDRYRVFSRGQEIGEVFSPFDPQPFTMDENFVKAAFLAKDGFSGKISGIATEQNITSDKCCVMRDPSPEEAERALSFAKLILKEHNVSAPLLEGLKKVSLDAVDLGGDGSYSLVGTYEIAVHGCSVHTVFLIADPKYPASSSEYSLDLAWYHHTKNQSCQGENDVQIPELLDSLDIDGDGNPWVVVEVQLYEGSGFEVYKKVNGTYRMIFPAEKGQPTGIQRPRTTRAVRASNPQSSNRRSRNAPNHPSKQRTNSRHQKKSNPAPILPQGVEEY